MKIINKIESHCGNSLNLKGSFKVLKPYANKFSEKIIKGNLMIKNILSNAYHWLIKRLKVLHKFPFNSISIKMKILRSINMKTRT